MARRSSESSELLTPTATPSASPRSSFFPAMVDSLDTGILVSELTTHLRSDTFLVMRFDSQGRHTYDELSRSDILQIIRQAEVSDSPATEQFARQRNPVGVAVSPLGTFCDLQPVHMRDLRQLDELFNASNETSIVVRKQAVLINADPIRSIILRNETLVFVPDGADSLLLMLIKDFNECIQKPNDSASAYEFKALEALLDTLSRSLDDDYDRHAAEINKVLDSFINVSIMSGELETMRLMKNSMSDFEAQVDSIRRALMNLLDNEEDLRLLYLTKLHENPSLIYDLGSFDPEEVEVLLESYLKDISTTRTKSELLQHRIETAESLIRMKLDYARNYLLALQLIFSLVGVGLGVGTLITGIFGMNVRIDAPTASTSMFWWIVGIIIVGSVFVIWGGILYFRRQGLMIAT